MLVIVALYLSVVNLPVESECYFMWYFCIVEYCD